MMWRNVAIESEGIHTVESFSRKLNIKTNTGILYIHKLRENGFIETKRGKRGKRLYDISPVKLIKVGFRGFYDILNENSSIKINKTFEYRISNREPSIEETIIWAIKSKDYRIILGSIELFKKVSDWNLLIKLAEKSGFGRHVGALYSLAMKYFKIRNPSKSNIQKMKKSNVKTRFFIEKVKSGDFQEIENEWKVFLPFNKKDIEKLEVGK